jgi:hypothetical protein
MQGGTGRYSGLMQQQFFFQYGGFELHCKPHEEPHGRYAARLQIVRQHGKRREEHTIDLSDVPAFDSATLAADHARVIGQAWVDQHGGPRLQ